MLAAVDWQVLYDRVFHPGHVWVVAIERTIYISVAAQILGVFLGLDRRPDADVALLAVSLPVRAATCWFFRGTPVIVQIFFVYFGTNLLFGFTLIPNQVDWLVGLDGAAFAGILALGINEGAYMREIIRAGIDSIDKGQMEAAKSLGMRSTLAMRRIILPQAARVIVPPLGNEFNNMMKTTLARLVHRRLRAVPGRGGALLEQLQAGRGLPRRRVVVPDADARSGAFIQSRIERRLAVSDRATTS